MYLCPRKWLCIKCTCMYVCGCVHVCASIRMYLSVRLCIMMERKCTFFKFCMWALYNKRRWANIYLDGVYWLKWLESTENSFANILFYWFIKKCVFSDVYLARIKAFFPPNKLICSNSGRKLHSVQRAICCIRVLLSIKPVMVRSKNCTCNKWHT